LRNEHGGASQTGDSSGNEFSSIKPIHGYWYLKV